VGVTVLTLNLWHDAGPWPERLALIQAEIDRLQPDLIGFQEVLVGERTNLVRQIVEGRNYQVEFGAASPFHREEKLSFGNSVASRWPLTGREELRLPDGDDGETRAALSVAVESPFGPISFTSTHLNWKFHHGAIRERQVVALCDRVRSLRPRGGFPPILVGDFNAEPGSTEIRYVSGLQSLHGRSVYFVDAWKARGTGGDGITWSNRNDYAREWLEPERRIDYVFVGPPRRDGLGLVERCRVCCCERIGGVWPSDHFGVVAELRTDPVDVPA
jgi:endonuclease/exonuclease/phosphatase family metal-dependent hydrolase